MELQKNTDKKHINFQTYKKHLWIMLVSCIGAVLLLIFLPFMGLSKNLTTVVALIFMIGSHLLMMKNHFH